MKILGLAILFLVLGGCGSYQTLEELEQQAFETGDWSEVEKRERILARRGMRTGSLCSSGATQYCESWGASTKCSCMADDRLREIIDRW